GPDAHRHPRGSGAPGLGLPGDWPHRDRRSRPGRRFRSRARRAGGSLRGSEVRVTRTMLLAILLSLVVGAAPATGQAPAPIEDFVRRVSYLWEAKDVDNLVDLVTDSEPVVLDRGSGSER